MEYLSLKEREVREVSDRVASANQTATEQENVAIKENLKQLTQKEATEGHK